MLKTSTFCYPKKIQAQILFNSNIFVRKSQYNELLNFAHKFCAIQTKSLLLHQTVGFIHCIAYILLSFLQKSDIIKLYINSAREAMLQFYLSLVETEEERSLVEKLYTEYEQKMFRMAMSILHNKHSAEDAVHESFLKIIKSLDKLTFENDIKTEALMIITVKRVSLSILKKAQRISSIESIDENAEDEGAGKAFRQIEENYVVEIINMLPDELREIITMRYILKIDVNTISKIIGLAPATIYVHLRKAKEIMRKILEDEYGIKRF